jgi:hypothetical protein
MSEKMLRARDHAASAASHVHDAHSALRCYVIGRFDDFRLKRMQTGQSPCVAVMNLYNEHITKPEPKRMRRGATPFGMAPRRFGSGSDR